MKELCTCFTYEQTTLIFNGLNEEFIAASNTEMFLRWKIAKLRT